MENTYVQEKELEKRQRQEKGKLNMTHLEVICKIKTWNDQTIKSKPWHKYKYVNIQQEKWIICDHKGWCRSYNSITRSE